jgi:hypothetical protein
LSNPDAAVIPAHLVGELARGRPARVDPALADLVGKNADTTLAAIST